VTSIRRWLLIGLLACSVQLGAAQDAAFAPVAHSALVTVEAGAAPQGVRLRLRRTQGAEPLVVTELRVSLEGQGTTVTPQPDGTWLASWPKTRGKPDAGLEVVVAHDGVREVLSGPMPSPPAKSAPAASSGTKQLAWWILNITIVLIAVVAISRRMS